MEVNSSVNKFVLLGLTQNLLKDKVVFVIFLLLYLATLLVNILIVMTIRNRQILGSPMYFFFFYLSFADACFSTTTAPRLIVDSVSEKKVISFNGCMTQIFAFHFFGGMGILVLVLMSFDCYVAICKLLWYTAIMSQKCPCHTGETGLGGGLYPFFSTDSLGFEITLLWPQCYWSLFLWYTAIFETCLHWYLCHQSPHSV